MLSVANDNEKDLEAASASSNKYAETYIARLLHSFVRTNNGFSLRELAWLLDASAETLALFENVVLLASTLFVSHLVLFARGISEVESPTCTRCLR